MAVSKEIKDMVSDVMGGRKPLYVGYVGKHPKTGKTVRIVGGQYWGEYGISNFWDWQEVLPDGSLGRLNSGYGWHI